MITITNYHYNITGTTQVVWSSPPQWCDGQHGLHKNFTSDWGIYMPLYRQVSPIWIHSRSLVSQHLQTSAPTHGTRVTSCIYTSQCWFLVEGLVYIPWLGICTIYLRWGLQFEFRVGFNYGSPLHSTPPNMESSSNLDIIHPAFSKCEIILQNHVTKYFHKAKEHGAQWQLNKATVSLVYHRTYSLLAGSLITKRDYNGECGGQLLYCTAHQWLNNFWENRLQCCADFSDHSSWCPLAIYLADWHLQPTRGCTTFTSNEYL